MSALHHIVNMAQEIKEHGGTSDRRDVAILREVFQRAKPCTRLRDRREQLPHHLCWGGIGGRRKHERIHGGEPPDRAADVESAVGRGASVTFNVH